MPKLKKLDELFCEVIKEDSGIDYKEYYKNNPYTTEQFHIIFRTSANPHLDAWTHWTPYFTGGKNACEKMAEEIKDGTAPPPKNERQWRHKEAWWVEIQVKIVNDAELKMLKDKSLLDEA